VHTRACVKLGIPQSVFDAIRDNFNDPSAGVVYVLRAAALSRFLDRCQIIRGHTPVDGACIELHLPGSGRARDDAGDQRT
jgi:hypothetical protein